jgi:hypothetical protein
MKLWMKAIVLALLSALAPGEARAQEPRPTAVCPTITISCPDGGASVKELTFTARVEGGDASVTPSYKWSVSGGKINAGQGTPEIVVEPEMGRAVTAVLEVGGYPSSCPTSNSCTTNACNLPVMARKLDEYGDISSHEERERLGSFMLELMNDPTTQGYVIVYAGRRARKGEARERGQRARSYLVGARGLEPSRLVVVDGGHREAPAVELFIVPAEAVPPVVTPTVNPSEVEIVEEDGEERRPAANPPKARQRPKSPGRR